MYAPTCTLPRAAFALLVALSCAGAYAQVLDCSLNDESVSPNHGGTTAGKTGLMRCVDRETRVLARETEYRDGRTIGVSRWYRGGVLQREHSVDERGNRDGVAREWNTHGVLVSERRYAGGDGVGLHREWYQDGTPRTVEHWGARTVPVGAHRAYDADGRLVAERVFDDRGRISRERDWDASGRLVRDDEVHEDGSRKRTAPGASAERRS
jgi:YD repeat-containing protein